MQTTAALCEIGIDGVCRGKKLTTIELYSTSP